MENASKALLIAAGMLIAVLVASMFALLFSTMSDYAKEYENRNLTQDIQKFNAQFEQYMKNGEATAQDIVSVYNLAKYYNKEGINIEVYIGTNQLDFANEKPFPLNKTSEEFIEANIDIDDTDIEDGKTLYKINNFSAQVEEYESGRIKKVKFTLATPKILYRK